MKLNVIEQGRIALDSSRRRTIVGGNGMHRWRLIGLGLGVAGLSECAGVC